MTTWPSDEGSDGLSNPKSSSTIIGARGKAGRFLAFLTVGAHATIKAHHVLALLAMLHHPTIKAQRFLALLTVGAHATIEAKHFLALFTVLHHPTIKTQVLLTFLTVITHAPRFRYLWCALL